MSWALSRRDLGKDSSARHVLLCLANYAGSDGRGAFPSAKTLTDDTGLSERTVRLKLDLLEERGLIVRGNQALAAVYIDRHDRRPVVYDLMLKRGAATAPREDGAGCIQQPNGVQPTTERGAATAPNPSLNHQVTEEQQQREISGAIAEQERQALEATDERQRFAMFAGWQPHSGYLIAQAQIAGVEPDDISDQMIRQFKGFFAARPSKVESSAGWCNRLVAWFCRERAKKAGGSAEPDFDDLEWANNLGDL